MTSDRRPLWRPSPETPARPAQVSPEARLTAVERAQVPLPPADGPVQPPVRGARRPLGPGGLVASADV
ncbi:MULTISPECIES: hypothetical protein [Streptomycetaceae]|uniref:hypothetical protein n=1 Tax=Streptomycetaceae TaxID=2062 RepID=UPI001160FD23|nr:hypothetical protein [Streptomyces sp. CB02056]